MAIITISRGSYSMGRAVAEAVAQRLGYRLTSRDVLLEASDRFRIPEVKLVRAIHDAPSILERFTHGKQRYLAYIQSALTSQAKADNLVYHGLAGHLLLPGAPHVLRVRIIADMESRVAAEMARENLSAAEARALLQKDDAERRKWTQSLYGVDPWDAALYDLVLHIGRLSQETAADLIVQAAQAPEMQTTPQAQRVMDDLALACQIKAELVRDDVFDVAVASEFGNVVVYAAKGARLEDKLTAIAGRLAGINHIEARAGQAPPPEAV
ncbi:response regulator receiver protein [Desulfarculus baarsii DSM 2075]|uniref:Response regulator receiver protein n=1 Tax=Desulfarculus baarsii (strain ATCC 33931 / DSM 2075 / LMG 7858 / VKM B-1802 / 2st14) TaxID=644282 RepID=E1QDQ7_DESB2|nr:cytidylate kinase-like family protein [Desulfarculus baarsii]ADK83693.1 response regulator receiver protein [Desulfarculus baarsii DSM 2075]